MENDIAKTISNVAYQAIQSIDDLLEGKLTQRTLDLGSHEMFIETREKRVTDIVGDLPIPPAIPLHLQPQIKSKA